MTPPRPHLRVLRGPDKPVSAPKFIDPGLANPDQTSPTQPSPDEATPDHFTAEQRQLRSDIEAVLLIAEAPVTYRQLATAVDSSELEVRAACAALEAEYRAVGRGFEIALIAGGVRLQTTAESTAAVRRFVSESNSARLSAAAMETLAVVAYKQPVSRSHITAIRGVNADAVVRSLCERGYLTEAERDPGPGKAALLRTTDLFLTQLGINSLVDLPSLADLDLDADMIDRLAADDIA